MWSRNAWANKVPPTEGAHPDRHIAQAGIVRARGHLFSGLTKCGVCGGGYNLSSRDDLRCINNTSRGTCTNARTIKRQDVEARVLRAIREKLFEPGAFAEFCASFTERMNRLRREHRVKMAAAPREIAAINRRSKEIMELLLQGFRDDAWKDELRQIEARRAELTPPLAAADAAPPLPALHPQRPTYIGRRRSSLPQRWGTKTTSSVTRLARRFAASWIES